MSISGTKRSTCVPSTEAEEQARTALHWLPACVPDAVPFSSSAPRGSNRAAGPELARVWVKQNARRSLSSVVQGKDKQIAEKEEEFEKTNKELTEEAAQLRKRLRIAGLSIQ